MKNRARTQVRFPVPIEKIVEQILHLDFDWVEIEEREGEQILAGLVPEQRRIVLNSRHLDLFAAKPGLERSTIGHEAGHWDIDIDRTSLHHPRLPGFEMSECVVCRHATDQNVLVEVLNRAVYDDRYFELYRELTAGQDPPEVKSAVDRYQSSMLMPAWLVREAITGIDVTNWSSLYDLAELAQVTISNLVVRLHRLDVIYIPADTKDIYPGKDAFLGQLHLFQLIPVIMVASVFGGRNGTRLILTLPIPGRTLTPANIIATGTHLCSDRYDLLLCEMSRVRSSSKPELTRERTP